MATDRLNCWRWRYNRRSVLRTGEVAGAGVAGLALAGCGGDDNDGNGNGAELTESGDTGATASPSAGDIVQGGTLTLNMNGSPRSLDPRFGTFPYNMAVTTQTCDGLITDVQQSKELEFERRQELVREVQRLIVLQFPAKFLYRTNNHSFTGSRVRNWFWSTGLYDGRVHDVWLAERVAA